MNNKLNFIALILFLLILSSCDNFQEKLFNKNEVEISKKKKENYELLKKQAARRAAENAAKKGSADIINNYVNPKKKES